MAKRRNAANSNTQHRDACKQVNGEPLEPGVPFPPMTYMSLGITRLGNSAGKCRVQWSTFDLSARAGAHYIGVKPTWVEFQPGEVHKDVTVGVIPCLSFDGTVELGLYIDVATAENCNVGKVRVKIINPFTREKRLADNCISSSYTIRVFAVFAHR